MNYLNETVSDEEFVRWFDEALYQFSGTDLYFRHVYIIAHKSHFVRCNNNPEKVRGTLHEYSHETDVSHSVGESRYDYSMSSFAHR